MSQKENSNVNGENAVDVNILDEVNVQEYAKRGEAVPKARHYVIRIDDQNFRVSNRYINGLEVLQLVNKSPVEWDVYLIGHHGGQELIEPEQSVDLQGHGVERFRTVRKMHNDGEVMELRRQFQMRESDTEFLESLGLPWESIQANGVQWIVIHDWPLPEGYSIDHCRFATPIPPNYPDTKLDMPLFSPAPNRLDGKSIPAVTPVQVAGEQFWQWSRHRDDSKDPWKPGEDCLETHFAHIRTILREELRR